MKMDSWKKALIIVFLFFFGLFLTPHPALADISNCSCGGQFATCRDYDSCQPAPPSGCGANQFVNGGDCCNFGTMIKETNPDASCYFGGNGWVCAPCGGGPGGPPDPTPVPTTCDYGGWSACGGSCGSGGTQSRSDNCGNTQTQSCCHECGPSYGAWSQCVGSPAQKTRSVTYSCQANSTQTNNCFGSFGNGGGGGGGTGGSGGGAAGGVRAVIVGRNETQCTNVRASTDGISGTTFSFTPSSPTQASKNQSGAAYVQFNNLVGGTYTLVADTHSVSYIPKLYCYNSSVNGMGSSASLSWNLAVPADNENISWDLGYVFGYAWTQAAGGADVYAAGQVKSLVPGVTPRYFNLDGSGGYPGVVTHGAGYDFDIEDVTTGGQLVSSRGWLANEAYPAADFYQLLYQRLGGKPVSVDYVNPGSVSQPVNRKAPYYVSGDMVTNGNWSVSGSDPLIFVVDGNLTIGGRINISGSGFAAFIVKGNITVNPGVGTSDLTANATPVVEGVYVANGTFFTGNSSVSGRERLVGKGVFMANGFSLERDLDSILANGAAAAELWIYNPKLLITMPDLLRDVAYRWEEVAP